MTIHDDQIAAWITAGGPHAAMRLKANELLTGSLSDHSGGLTEHEILANALQGFYEEGQRDALEESLTSPIDVNECTTLEYELRGPEALLVFANSGEAPDWRASLFIMAKRWAIAIRDRAQMRAALEAAEPLVGWCAAVSARLVDGSRAESAEDAAIKNTGILALVRAALGKSG